MKTISLKDYLSEQKNELKKLQEKVDLLVSAKVPLRVRVFGDSADDFELYSENYSLAEDFKIFKRSEHISGTSGYDGGYSTDRFDTYPQFYFNLGLQKALPVYIQHPGFDEDKRIVIKSITRTEGCKDYSSMNGTNENYVDLKKVFEFFKKKGVRENLLEKLEARIKQADEI